MRRTLWVVVLLLSGRGLLASPADYARAETFYQRGRHAEQISDAEYARWIQTINVGHFDTHADRAAFAIDQYMNAVRLDPAHWRAHRQLGLLLNRYRGTQANEQLAAVHMVAYLALQPEDALADTTKDRLDSMLLGDDPGQGMFGRIDWASRIDFLEAVAVLQHPDTMEEFRAFIGGYTNMAGRQLGRLTPVAAATSGSFADLQDEGIAHHEAMTGLYRSRLDTAGEDLSGDKRTLEETVTRSAAYVSNYLYFIGSMHRFMNHLKVRGIPFDPRLPNALIGESIAQIRLLFTKNQGWHITGTILSIEYGNYRTYSRNLRSLWMDPDPAYVQDEYSRLAELGDVSTGDLWGTRDYTRPLPDEYVEAGTVEQPGRDRQAYNTVVAASNLNLPRYQVKEDEPGFNEAITAAADVTSHEAWKEWVKWRHIHLWKCAEAYGLDGPDQLYVRDYIRVGSGEISRWERGPMGRAEMTTGQTDDRAWLMAAAD